MTTRYNLAEQTVNANGIVSLTTTVNQKGCNTASAVDGVKILKAGIYDVFATVTGLVTAGGTLNVVVTRNGEEIPYLVGQSYTTAGQPDTITLAGQIIVNSNCCAVSDNVPVTLQIVNNGDTAEVISFASLSIVKR